MRNLIGPLLEDLQVSFHYDDNMKWFYELVYGRFRAPWEIGPRIELVQLVESGRLKPC